MNMYIISCLCDTAKQLVEELCSLDYCGPLWESFQLKQTQERYFGGIIRTKIICLLCILVRVLYKTLKVRVSLG